MWVAALPPEAVVALVAASLAILGFAIDRLGGLGLRLMRKWREPKRLTKALADLRPGVQRRVFTETLGREPIRSAGSAHLYVFDSVFVDVEADEYDNVGRFAVTVRKMGFKPKLRMGPGGDVVLGETTYAGLGLDGLAQGLTAWRSGAGRHTMYAESYYFGNPGNYQCWVVASNPTSEIGLGGESIDAVVGALALEGGVLKIGAFEVDAPFGGEMPDCWYTRPPIRRFRESTPINTLSVTGANGSPDPEPGPWIDEVRVFAPHYVMPGKGRDALRIALAMLVLVALVAGLLWLGWPVDA